MRRFATLFIELDRTTRTSEKLAALERYFRDAPPEDAAWAAWLLAGNTLKRLMPSRELRAAVGRRAELPSWLIDECRDVVGDMAETLALLLPDPDDVDPPPLGELVEQHVRPLRTMLPDQRDERLASLWARLDRTQRFLLHKLMLGNLRVGVARTTVIKALAAVAEVEPAVMTHRMSGQWEPSAESFRALLDGESDPALKPYPFFLAHAASDPVDMLGPIDDFLVEWKLDGVRAQLIRRDETLLWSRGEELVNDAFPELVAAAKDLPRGTVLDGEIAAWDDDGPMPFSTLQRRLNRKRVEPALWVDVPVVFVAFDLLERDGVDWRERPLVERRAALETLLGDDDDSTVRVSPRLEVGSWAALEQLQRRSRDRGMEGVMLKRLDAPYGVGRRRGAWWKWKVDPFTVDAVMLYAQRGSGRRAGLFTDYTFGVWSDGELVPIAKAYSGLTDDEFRRVNRFIRGHTLGRHGPVHVVEPTLVFELAFDGVQPSDRHKAGVALRFPRMTRWRKDKPPEEADRLETVRALMSG